VHHYFYDGVPLMTRGQAIVFFLTFGSWLWSGLLLATLSSAVNYLTADRSAPMVKGPTSARVENNQVFVKPKVETSARSQGDTTVKTKAEVNVTHGVAVQVGVDVTGHTLSLLIDQPVTP
jgi:hypothetical protein